jgi:hypothetical protein
MALFADDPDAATFEAQAQAVGCTTEEEEPPVTVTCEIGEFFRKALSKRLIWNHAYLEATCTFDGGDADYTFSQVIQADPGQKAKGNIPGRVGGLGGPWLIGQVVAPYAGAGHSAAGAPGNFQVGSWEPIPYAELLQIDNDVYAYNYNAQPYTLFPYSSDTYNSNSFIYTLDVNFNLGFARPPGRDPGWGNCVPNLPFPTCQ